MIKRITICVLMASFLAACGGHDDDAAVTRAVKNHFERDLCVNLTNAYPWVIDYESRNKIKLGQGDALTAAGFMTKKQATEDEGIMGYRIAYAYAPTKKGRKHMNENGAFCYGAVTVDKIHDITYPEPDTAMISFTAIGAITQDWAHDASFAHSNIVHGKQLGRTFFTRGENAEWHLRPKDQ